MNVPDLALLPNLLLPSCGTLSASCVDGEEKRKVFA
jgi:hypothetical protein